VDEARLQTGVHEPSDIDGDFAEDGEQSADGDAAEKNVEKPIVCHPPPFLPVRPGGKDGQGSVAAVIGSPSTSPGRPPSVLYILGSGDRDLRKQPQAQSGSAAMPRFTDIWLAAMSESRANLVCRFATRCRVQPLESDGSVGTRRGERAAPPQ
jgi:hypothetical protein